MTCPCLIYYSELATGESVEKVPWKTMERDPYEFFRPEFWPDSVPFTSPRTMTRHEFPICWDFFKQRARNVQNQTAEVTFEFDYVVMEGESVGEKIPSRFDPSSSPPGDASETQDESDTQSKTVFSTIPSKEKRAKPHGRLRRVHRSSSSSSDSEDEDDGESQPEATSDGRSSKTSVLPSHGDTQSSDSDSSDDTDNEVVKSAARKSRHSESIRKLAASFIDAEAHADGGSDSDELDVDVDSPGSLRDFIDDDDMFADDDNPGDDAEFSDDGWGNEPYSIESVVTHPGGIQDVESAAKWILSSIYKFEPLEMIIGYLLHKEVRNFFYRTTKH